ncbi:helix-turn-helix domain-containing protein [Sungkyunkwania multivorans]|uniref:Helix-turn-helix domain-containing protein n=1 Tax=Sungkyunkwania multivorans TaxID=1173618 RepID=A0ABW3CS74_9FLAO
MQTITVTDISPKHISNQINEQLQGNLTADDGECVISLDNALGKGKIRTIDFDWGLTLLDLELALEEDVEFIFQQVDQSPIWFIFITEGSLSYHSCVQSEMSTKLERFQNIIIATNNDTKTHFAFPKGESLKVNLIVIDRNKFKNKKGYDLGYLSNTLNKVFEAAAQNENYKHLGNYNLRIADQIKLLKDSHPKGMVKMLSIEGRLNMILALQILEHHNFENKIDIPESLTAADIEKIHELTNYIKNHLAEHTTIKTLSMRSGLSPKKLQLAFKMLFDQTVNEYIRQIRLEQARDLLQNTDLTVSEIVYQIGLKSRSYFSRIFFERYSMLPTSFRKKKSPS